MPPEKVRLDPEKAKDSRKKLYSSAHTLIAEAKKSGNRKLSLRSINEIENGREVKIQTAKDYAAIVGESLINLMDSAYKDKFNEKKVTIDLSGKTLFGHITQHVMDGLDYRFGEDGGFPPPPDMLFDEYIDRGFLNKHINLTDLEPCSLVDLLEHSKSSSQNFKQLVVRENTAEECSSDPIWISQPSIIIGKEALQILKELESIITESDFSEETFSSKSLIKTLEKQENSRILFEQLLDYGLAFFIGKLQSQVITDISGSNKEIINEKSFPHLEHVTRNIIVIADRQLERIQIQYEQLQIEIPF